ncbi:MAG TPA: TIGR03067 domain-containing protein, partial [Urbifossiella sp.]|nr:TIGR03067 domain-containing protein [Urbifossiella sp.]
RHPLPTTALLAASLAAAVCAAGPAKGQDGDQKALQGKWAITRAEAGGRPDKEAIGLVYTFEGDRLTMATPRPVTMQATFRLEATKTPKRMTFTILDEAKEEVVNTAIYDLDGDTLKLCGTWNSRVGVRHPFPKGFGTAKGDSSSYLLVLARQKADK